MYIDHQYKVYEELLIDLLKKVYTDCTSCGTISVFRDENPPNEGLVFSHLDELIKQGFIRESIPTPIPDFKNELRFFHITEKGKAELMIEDL